MAIDEKLKDAKDQIRGIVGEQYDLKIHGFSFSKREGFTLHYSGDELPEIDNLKVELYGHSVNLIYEPSANAFPANKD